MADASYEDVIRSGRFSYRAFVERFDAIMARDGAVAPVRSPLPKAEFYRARTERSQQFVSVEGGVEKVAPIHRGKALLAAQRRRAFWLKLPTIGDDLRARGGDVVARGQVLVGAAIASLRRPHMRQALLQVLQDKNRKPGDLAKLAEELTLLDRAGFDLRNPSAPDYALPVYDEAENILALRFFDRGVRPLTLRRWRGGGARAFLRDLTPRLKGPAPPQVEFEFSRERRYAELKTVFGSSYVYPTQCGVFEFPAFERLAARDPALALNLLEAAFRIGPRFELRRRWWLRPALALRPIWEWPSRLLRAARSGASIMPALMANRGTREATLQTLLRYGGARKVRARLRELHLLGVLGRIGKARAFVPAPFHLSLSKTANGYLFETRPGHWDAADYEDQMRLLNGLFVDLHQRKRPAIAWRFEPSLNPLRWRTGAKWQGLTLPREGEVQFQALEPIFTARPRRAGEMFADMLSIYGWRPPKGTLFADQIAAHVAKSPIGKAWAAGAMALALAPTFTVTRGLMQLSFATLLRLDTWTSPARLKARLRALVSLGVLAGLGKARFFFERPLYVAVTPSTTGWSLDTSEGTWDGAEVEDRIRLVNTLYTSFRAKTPLHLSWRHRPDQALMWRVGRRWRGLTPAGDGVTDFSAMAPIFAAVPRAGAETVADVLSIYRWKPRPEPRKPTVLERSMRTAGALWPALQITPAMAHITRLSFLASPSQVRARMKPLLALGVLVGAGKARLFFEEQFHVALVRDDNNWRLETRRGPWDGANVDALRASIDQFWRSLRQKSAAPALSWRHYECAPVMWRARADWQGLTPNARGEIDLSPLAAVFKSDPSGAARLIADALSHHGWTPPRDPPAENAIQRNLRTAGAIWPALNATPAMSAIARASVVAPLRLRRRVKSLLTLGVLAGAGKARLFFQDQFHLAVVRDEGGWRIETRPGGWDGADVEARVTVIDDLYSALRATDLAPRLVWRHFEQAPLMWRAGSHWQGLAPGENCEIDLGTVAPLLKSNPLAAARLFADLLSIYGWRPRAKLKVRAETSLERNVRMIGALWPALHVTPAMAQLTRTALLAAPQRARARMKPLAVLGVLAGIGKARLFFEQPAHVAPARDGDAWRLETRRGAWDGADVDARVAFVEEMHKTLRDKNSAPRLLWRHYDEAPLMWRAGAQWQGLTPGESGEVDLSSLTPALRANPRASAALLADVLSVYGWKPRSETKARTETAVERNVRMAGALWPALHVTPAMAKLTRTALLTAPHEALARTKPLAALGVLAGMGKARLFFETPVHAALVRNADTWRVETRRGAWDGADVDARVALVDELYCDLRSKSAPPISWRHYDQAPLMWRSGAQWQGLAPGDGVDLSPLARAFTADPANAARLFADVLSIYGWNPRRDVKTRAETAIERNLRMAGALWPALHITPAMAQLTRAALLSAPHEARSRMKPLAALGVLAGTGKARLFLKEKFHICVVREGNLWRIETRAGGWDGKDAADRLALLRDLHGALKSGEAVGMVWRHCERAPLEWRAATQWEALTPDTAGEIDLAPLLPCFKTDPNLAGRVLADVLSIYRWKPEPSPPPAALLHAGNFLGRLWWLATTKAGRERASWRLGMLFGARSAPPATPAPLPTPPSGPKRVQARRQRRTSMARRRSAL